MCLRSMKCFNPRPLLLTGESAPQAHRRTGQLLFQSTPVIANGRIPPGAGAARQPIGFNPRPLLLTGESPGAVALCAG